MNQLTPSNENKDFMEHQKTYDKNKSNIILKDDNWYYNDKKFVTNSHLGKILKGGPQTLKAYYEKGSPDSDAFIFGRAAHCLLLEPDAFSGRFYAVDDTQLCIEASGKDWKENKKSPKTTKIYKTKMLKIKSANKHRDLLSLDNFNAMNNMIDKAMGYKRIRDLVEAASKREVIYQKKILGINCKIKVDAINPSNFIMDYKTTSDPATLFNFQRSVNKYSYDRQGSFYSDVAGVDTFWFLVQSKVYPYTLCLAELSPNSYEVGKKKYEQGLGMYKFYFIDNPKDIDTFLEVGCI